jgi:hypothetical protein
MSRRLRVPPLDQVILQDGSLRLLSLRSDLVAIRAKSLDVDDAAQGLAGADPALHAECEEVEDTHGLRRHSSGSDPMLAGQQGETGEYNSTIYETLLLTCSRTSTSPPSRPTAPFSL